MNDDRREDGTGDSRNFLLLTLDDEFDLVFHESQARRSAVCVFFHICAVDLDCPAMSDAAALPPPPPPPRAESSGYDVLRPYLFLFDDNRSVAVDLFGFTFAFVAIVAGVYPFGDVERMAPA